MTRMLIGEELLKGYSKGVASPLSVVCDLLYQVLKPLCGPKTVPSASLLLEPSGGHREAHARWLGRPFAETPFSLVTHQKQREGPPPLTSLTPWVKRDLVGPHVSFMEAINTRREFEGASHPFDSLIFPRLRGRMCVLSRLHYFFPSFTPPYLLRN